MGGKGGGERTYVRTYIELGRKGEGREKERERKRVHDKRRIGRRLRQRDPPLPLARATHAAARLSLSRYTA